MTINEVIQAAKTFFANTPAVKPNWKNITTTRIHPSEIKTGDLMTTNGYIIKVTDIKVYAAPSHSTTNLPVYVVSGLYVAGDLDNYKFMCDYTPCGRVRTHINGIQGNEIATWTRVDSM